MPTATVEVRSARERLLDAADELFYAEGVNTVGIDRVIEHAGVAKATLYSAFGSKEELIRAYLNRRQARRAARINRHVAKYDDPRARLLAVYEALGEAAAEPNFRGCAFVRASAEARTGSKTATACEDYRTWVAGLFTDLARAAGAPDPVALGRELVMLYDGAATAAHLDGDRAAASTARTVAAVLLDRALAETA